MKTFYGQQVLLGLGLLALNLHAATAQTCSDGTPGVESPSGTTCCTPDCSQCGGEGCGSFGESCCGGAIADAGVLCADSGVAPCLLEPTPPETFCSDGTPGVESPSGTTCCTRGCSQCGGQGCGKFGEEFGLGSSDCCGGSIAEAGEFCSDRGEAPCLLTPPDTRCSDNITIGVDGNGVVCCKIGCGVCGGSGCSDRARDAGLTPDDCCGLRIGASDEYCDDNGNVAPCILGSRTPAPTTSQMITMPPTMAPASPVV